MTVKRNTLMSAVVARFQTITTANGYYSNLGSNVFEWRPRVLSETGGGYVPTEQSELPALHVRDPLDEVIAVNLKGQETHSLNLELEISHEGGATAATMRKEVSDVLKAVSTDTKWSGEAQSTSQEYTTETVRAQADRTFFRTLLRMKIVYTTSRYSES